MILSSLVSLGKQGGFGSSHDDRVFCGCFEGTTFSMSFSRQADPVLDIYLERKLKIIGKFFEINYMIFANIFFVFVAYCWLCILWIGKRKIWVGIILFPFFIL